MAMDSHGSRGVGKPTSTSSRHRRADTIDVRRRRLSRGIGALAAYTND
jgi:hypothetical protein